LVSCLDAIIPLKYGVIPMPNEHDEDSNIRPALSTSRPGPRSGADDVIVGGQATVVTMIENAIEELAD
jgi:hypothetical protein